MNIEAESDMPSSVFLRTGLFMCCSLAEVKQVLVP